MWHQEEIYRKYNKLIEKAGYKGVLAIFFYPAITFFVTPIQLVRSLWNCRILLEGKWQDYNGFNPRTGINNLFYWTRALNFYKYGRSGTSPTLGIGETFLGNLWFYTLFSLYAYRFFAPVVPLCGLFGWWISHLVYFDQVCVISLWGVAVMMLSLFSTTFYANTFVIQNYNALGWLFMPVGLYGWLTGNWYLAALAWFGACFSSFTIVFLACILSVFISISTFSFLPVLTTIPAGLKILTHFIPLIRNGKGALLKSVYSLAISLGMANRNVKYRRLSFKFDLQLFYYLFIYIQFAVILFFFERSVPWLLVTSIIIFLVNRLIARFADDQTIFMLVFSVATALMMIVQNNSPFLLFSYWILVSPMPLLVQMPRTYFAIVPVFKPFYVHPIITEMRKFLSPVSKGQRVLMAFNDPHGIYSNIFDGYRVILEAPLYVAACKEIHFMPDFWGKTQLNYEGAPDFWGRSVDDVKRQLEAWNADYAVIYQDSGTEIDSKWEEAGFEILSFFSWSIFDQDFGDSRPYDGPTPDWWLLRYKFIN